MAMLSPPATPAMSQDSTVFGIDSSITLDSPRKPSRRRTLERVISRDILIFLIAFRAVNALSIKTFFQPDEYFQSLEPAWEIAFGANSGAWITWEWKTHLRSSIHPALFAIVYWIAAGLSWLLRLSPSSRANLLIAAPKVAQAVCAALCDYYTWKFGEKIFGVASNEAWAGLVLTALSPWQWFCSTRTLSNCLEATLTIFALYHWPWEWSVTKSDDTSEESVKDEDSSKEQKPVAKRDEASGETSTDQYSNQEQQEEDFIHVGEGSPGISGSLTIATVTEQPSQPPLADKYPLHNNLRICLLSASLACILRPTNTLIWICLSSYAFIRTTTYGHFMETRFLDSPIWVHFTTLDLLPSTAEEREIFVREGIICGSCVIALSSLIDFLYYRQITFPPLRFLYFNLAQSLAAFYGQNRRDYYLTEGVPLLLTTYLPFGIIGIYHSLSPPRNNPTFINTSSFTRTIKYQLAATCLIVPSILSLISHKEVRFIYPLLPLFHLLAATPFTTYFLPAISPAIPRRPLHIFKRVLLLLMFIANVTIALLSTTSHQTAPLSVLTYLRNQHSTHYLSQPPPHTLAPAPSTMTVGFLMPCHSTPWRSHLVFPSIKAWALGCEPPVNLNSTARAAYVDEADRFYAAPKAFLSKTLGPPPWPRKQSVGSWLWPLTYLVGGAGEKNVKRGFGREEMIEADAWDGRPGRKSWPEYLVFFAEKEQLLRQVAKGSAYRECWRGWNAWGHDDWRRRGDVVVWCLRSQRAGKRRWW